MEASGLAGTADPHPSKLPANKNEIRVASHGKIKNYVQYAINVFKSSIASEIIIKSCGNDISKAVTVAEITKRRVPGLHQISRIGSQPRTNKQPLSNDSDQESRAQSWITITLSLLPLDKSDLSYQPPLPAEQVVPLDAPPPSRSAAVVHSGNSRRGVGRRVRGRGGGALKFGGMSDMLLDALTGPLPPAPGVVSPPLVGVTSMAAERDNGPQTKGKKKQKRNQHPGRQQQPAARGAHSGRASRNARESTPADAAATDITQPTVPDLKQT